MEKIFENKIKPLAQRTHSTTIQIEQVESLKTSQIASPSQDTKIVLKEHL